MMTPPEILDHQEHTEVRRDYLRVLAAAFMIVVVVAAVAAPLLAPHDPAGVSLSLRLRPPIGAKGGSWSHVLGTDGLGRDMLSRLIFGLRTSLAIGVGVVVIAGIGGTLLGITAGYIGGWWDTAVMRWVDFQLAFPGLLLVLLVLSATRASIPVLIVVLSLLGWMVYARLARAQTLSLRSVAYVEAANLSGVPRRVIVRRHVFPNIASPLAAQAVTELARVMLAEASLSYLGLGIQPPSTSLGLMVSENQQYISKAWWGIVLPGVLIVLTVLSFNVTADAIRRGMGAPHRQPRRRVQQVVGRLKPGRST